MTTVGEPIEPEAWRWYYDEVGKREAVITDTWWLTETGGFLGTTVPAIHAMKPGSCGPGDRKSTRLNSSHGYISYAVFCLKKKTERLYETHNRGLHARK